MTNHPPFQRPARLVPWDRVMLAQLPSGQSDAWYVTLDHHQNAKLGRILNIRTRREFSWVVAPTGKVISVRGVEPVIPKHVFTTIKSLLVRPTQDDLTAAAQREISCLTTLIFDLAANLGQKLSDVKDMNWFIRRVEDRLIAECKRFSHLNPNYKEQ